jgi:hypothetical protein
MRRSRVSLGVSGVNLSEREIEERERETSVEPDSVQQLTVWGIDLSQAPQAPCLQYTPSSITGENTSSDTRSHRVTGPGLVFPQTGSQPGRKKKHFIFNEYCYIISINVVGNSGLMCVGQKYLSRA